MPVVSCKCPNCDGGMVFSPEKQLFVCEYCGTTLTRAEMDAQAAEQASTETEQEQAMPQEPAQAKTAQPEDTGTFDAQGYQCPSCGAEVFTDDSTAATYCYYCHNPVVLTGRLSGALRPDYVIPFAIQRKDAEQRFLSWCRGKWFLRRDFYSTVQLEKLTGMYFPFWLADVGLDCRMTASARDVRVWRTGDVEYTETSVYDIDREADVSFDEMSFAAINREDMQLAAGVCPFDHQKAQEFSMAYLAGFQAEKRGIESRELEPEMTRMVQEYSQTLVRETIKGHGSISVKDFAARTANGPRWQYTLLPVWTLTCRYGDKLFYYALNGQTGKVCGRLPVDPVRLTILGIAVGVISAAIALLLGGLIG